MNLEDIKNIISFENGKEIRKKIYEKARELFPNSVFFGEIDPESSSLTVFNSNGEQTIQSVVDVVKRYFERRYIEGAINEKDEKNITDFKEYLNNF